MEATKNSAADEINRLEKENEKDITELTHKIHHLIEEINAITKENNESEQYFLQTILSDPFV